MAKELFLEERPRSSCESDVYAFGGLILTVMSGKPPYFGIPAGRVLYRVMQNQPPKPEEHPVLSPDDRLWNLMGRCWNPKPKRRPQMKAIVQELREEICHECRVTTPSDLQPGSLLSPSQSSRPVQTQPHQGPGDELMFLSEFNSVENCNRFVADIRRVALEKGLYRDKQWVAQYAASRLKGQALLWHTLELDGGTRCNWDKLQVAILERAEGADATVPPALRHPLDSDRPVSPISSPRNAWSGSSHPGSSLSLPDPDAPLAGASIQNNTLGVTISLMKEGIDFGIIDVSSLSTSSFSKPLVVTSHKKGIAILGAKLRSMTEDRSTAQTTPFTVSVSPCAIAKGQSVTLQVNFVARNCNLLGVFTDHLEIQFRNNHASRNFVICQTVRAEVRNRGLSEELRNKVEYHGLVSKPAEGIKPEAIGTVGQRREDPLRVDWRKPLLAFPIPDRIVELVAGADPKSLLEKVQQTLMPKKLDLKTFAQYWQNLIFLEELQQRSVFAIPKLLKWLLIELDVKGGSTALLRGGCCFSSSRATLLVGASPRVLPAPGLAEKRPSVVIGDVIKIRLHGETKVTHSGYVHHLKGLGVLASIQKDFPHHPGSTYDVEFTLSRIRFRRQHAAVRIQDNKMKRFLFPEWKDVKAVPPSIPCKVHFSPVNRSISGNEPQEMAISRILSMAPGSAPFIIHGAFGTGKTTTLVEAIQQLYSRDNNVRILVCGPSDAAADNIATRLQNVGKSIVLRLNAVTRGYETLQPPDLKLFHKNFGLLCQDPERGGLCFYYPDYHTLLEYRIVVTTCVDAAVPSALGVEQGHFDWILVDKAGQAAEPEVLIPILELAGHNTNLVLCGDPHQIGWLRTIVYVAQSLTPRSYLLRLMEMEMYDEKGAMGQRNVTNLEAGADPIVTSRLIGWHKMPNPKFPIEFRGVVGQDQRESESPSFFNADEVLEVKDIVEALLSDHSMGWKGKDIGIIAPYGAQRSKIRAILVSSFHRDIKVGSVEEFQGQERPIIIISTTRSSPENVPFDLKYALGFVGFPRRLNVAVTRAQASLFIIGNPQILSLDPLWRSLLNYIRLNKGYTGPALDSRSDANGGVNVTIPDFHVPNRQQEHTANMDALERRIRGTVLHQLGLEVEDRYSDVST
ncbi:hypothetical protein FRC01_009928 [Tulasnella sp. 417]|nr:hypothetical protein FRC01_009928 [Tulasnella sp. 417]